MQVVDQVLLTFLGKPYKNLKSTKRKKKEEKKRRNVTSKETIEGTKNIKKIVEKTTIKQTSKASTTKTVTTTRPMVRSTTMRNYYSKENNFNKPIYPRNNQKSNGQFEYYDNNNYIQEYQCGLDYYNKPQNPGNEQYYSNPNGGDKNYYDECKDDYYDDNENDSSEDYEDEYSESTEESSKEEVNFFDKYCRLVKRVLDEC
uniref:Uncharacterized protein n=1 Tax=Strongyloides stercoralis TaxID=6248 RepID=A0AAF5DLG5_STRER